MDDSPLIVFGAERISCNTMDEGQNIMFSGILIHHKSSINGDKTFDVGIQIEGLIAHLANRPSGEVGILLIDDTLIIEGPDESAKFAVRLLECIKIDLPTFDYPLKMDIETKHLEHIIDTLKDFPSIIFSRENKGLHISEPSWEKFITICPKDITYVKNREGAFSTMISMEFMLKAFEVVSLYESILIGLGEDIPIVLLGSSDTLKMGFMIGAQVEDDGEES